MRSSDTSGADALGFRVDADTAKKHRPHDTLRLTRRARHGLSAVSFAFAATAFLSAALFVAYDVFSTFDDVKRELTTIGAMLSSDLTGQDPASRDDLLASAISRYPTVTRANFIADDVPQLGLFGQAFAVGDLGTFSLEIEDATALAGLAGRAGAAFFLAGLLVVLASRRRSMDMPELVQREGFQMLASAIPMGLACWSAQGDLITCNDDYRARLDIKERSVNYQDAVARLTAQGRMKQLRHDDTGRLLELHRDDGSYLLIDERPLDEGGFMTLVSDITERKRADALLTTVREEQRLLARRYHEEKLKAEAASHAKTNFLAHLSHDIRTPLNHIIGFAEMMRHETFGPLGDKRYAEYVQSIKASGEHLLASFANILDLAEMERGQKTFRQDQVPVDEVIATVARRFCGRAGQAGITLYVGPESHAVLRGDRLGLVRMVSNIVDNAIRFTPAGGEITVASFAAEDGVVIEVSDNGQGMDEARLASLSQPFALGDASFARNGTGPGLGISIARAIAEQSGGHMAVDSAPDLGTTVAFSLPIARMGERVAA